MVQTHSNKVVILDGYTDEPSILGVPPYIAPIVRYLYGSLLENNIHAKYYTIDQARTNNGVTKEISQTDYLFIIAGALLPGKYIRGVPISHKEVSFYANAASHAITFLGGNVAQFGYYNKSTKQFYPPEYFERNFTYCVAGDLDAIAFDYFNRIKHTSSSTDPILNELDLKRNRTFEELNKWSMLGAEVVAQHPDTKIGYTIADLDLFTGCVRYFTGGCSFCIEPTAGRPRFRDQNSIGKEVHALSKHGIRHFRLGGASCIFSYKTTQLGRSETPKPNVTAIQKLFKVIQTAAPDLKVLHTDNANPAILAKHPKEAKQVIQILLEYTTGGNILSFGLESVDKAVYMENNLNATAEECLKAIKLVNDMGGSEMSSTGLPKLLPGLNFLYGLKGETKATYKKNYQFLKHILEQDYLLRRINLRQVLAFRSLETQSKHLKWFYGHKKQVFEEIEQPMLKKLVPTGTVMRNLFIEIYKNGISYARQAGTYPLTIKIPEKLQKNYTYDVIVVSHNKKSLNGLIVPIKINSLSFGALKLLPLIGTKRAKKLMQHRPYSNFNDFLEVLHVEPSHYRPFVPFFKFDQ